MLTSLGRSALFAHHYLGELARLVWETCVSIVVAPLRLRLFIQQSSRSGGAADVVLVTGAFTARCSPRRPTFSFRAGHEIRHGLRGRTSLFRELGPVLTG